LPIGELAGQRGRSFGAASTIPKDARSSSSRFHGVEFWLATLDHPSFCDLSGKKHCVKIKRLPPRKLTWNLNNHPFGEENHLQTLHF